MILKWFKDNRNANININIRMMSNQELTGLPINSDQENINRLLNNFTREESEKNEIIDILEYKIQNNEFNEGLTDLKLSLNNRNIEDAKYSIDELVVKKESQRPKTRKASGSNKLAIKQVNIGINK